MSDHDENAPIWGVEEISKVLRRTPRATYYLIETRQLNVTKVGRSWVTTPRRLLAPIRGDEPAA